MLKIGIAGCGGKMGRALTSLSGSSPGWMLAAVSERPGNEKALAGINVPAVYTAKELADLCDAVIDFTAPEATLALAREVAAHARIHVIGTTGFTPAQLQELKTYAKTARIVQSGNLSLGVNVLEAVVEKVAAQLGPEYDIEIDEMHHRLKKDAPSGTALMLARAAAKGRGADERAFTRYGEGVIGARKMGSIGISVRRGGEVVGVHTVTLAGPGENLELTHRGFSRGIYAHGAIQAALWAQDKPAGFYSMRDVLGI